MTERTELSRRQLLKASGGLIAAIAGCYSQSDTDQTTKIGAAGMTNNIQDARLADQFYVAPTKAELETPGPVPAVGITNEGRYLYTQDADEWVGPVAPGTEDRPAGESHVEALHTEQQTTTEEIQLPTGESQTEGHAPTAHYLRPHPGAENPVADGSSITDVDNSVDGVADPFWSWENGQFYKFVEILESDGDRHIGKYTSAGGLDWAYQETVLSTTNSGAESHYAYPLVFWEQGTPYMTPSIQSNDCKLFTPDNGSLSASSWSVEEALFNPGFPVVDPTPFYYNDRWWVAFQRGGTTEMHIWHADSTGRPITGRSWSPHDQNPVTTAAEHGQPAGRWLPGKHSVEAFYQSDASPLHVSRYRITTLTPTSFSQSEVLPTPLLTESDVGWNSGSMHHVDYGQPTLSSERLVVVDGNGGGNKWRVGVYRPTALPEMVGRAQVDTAQNVGTSGNTTASITVKRNNGQLLDGANNQIVFPVAGTYRLDATILWNIYATGESAGNVSMFWWDGSSAFGRDRSHLGENADVGNQSTITYDADAGETVELKLENRTSATLDLVGADSQINAELVDR